MVKHFLTGSVATEELVIDRGKGSILFPPPQAVASDVHVVSRIYASVHMCRGRTVVSVCVCVCVQA